MEEKKEETLAEKRKKRLEKLDTRFSGLRNAAPYVNIPMTLLSTTIVGAIIGHLIERKWPSNGIFLMIFCMLGVAAGFKQILELVKKDSDKGKK